MTDNEITYRKLTESDLDTFIQMRITQLREEGATDSINCKHQEEKRWKSKTVE